MDGELNLPENPLDRYPIGTVIRTCNNYYIHGLVGVIVDYATLGHEIGENSYHVKFLKGSIEPVLHSNTEKTTITDFEKILYNVESLCL